MAVGCARILSDRVPDKFRRTVKSMSCPPDSAHFIDQPEEDRLAR